MIVLFKSARIRSIKQLLKYYVSLHNILNKICEYKFNFK